MKQIPQTENPLIVRTDFSNDAIWQAISHPDHPLLILNLFERSGQEFRAIPSQIQGIENNLSIANMDFEEFADAVDEYGIFRGFPIQ